jgi:hypothetical protein
MVRGNNVQFMIACRHIDGKPLVDVLRGRAWQPQNQTIDDKRIVSFGSMQGNDFMESSEICLDKSLFYLRKRLPVVRKMCY